MVRVNRILFSKLKARYEFVRFAAKIIYADRNIEYEQIEATDMTPEEFNELHRPVSARENEIRALRSSLRLMENQGHELLEKEKYELLAELKEIYNNTLKQLNKLL